MIYDTIYLNDYERSKVITSTWSLVKIMLFIYLFHSVYSNTFATLQTYPNTHHSNTSIHYNGIDQYTGKDYGI